MRPTAAATNGSRDEADGAPPPNAAPPPEGRSKARSLRIVVADDPATHPFYQQALARLGHQVCVARTGRQLVEQCHLLRPDLVFAAVQAPDLDGLAAAEEIGRGRPAPIILVSDGPDAELLRRARAGRCVLACLFKPLREADLGAAAAVAVSRFEQLESVRQEAAGLRQALEDRKLLERAKGLVMRYTGLNEEETYSRLRKVASDQNRQLAEVAQAVWSAGEVFQQLEHTAEGGREKNGRARGAGKERGPTSCGAPPRSAGGRPPQCTSVPQGREEGAKTCPFAFDEGGG